MDIDIYFDVRESNTKNKETCFDSVKTDKLTNTNDN